jgi:hypothetical protein
MYLRSSPLIHLHLPCGKPPGYSGPDIRHNH